MRIPDYYIHTHFSPDSSMKLEEAVTAAIKAGTAWTYGEKYSAYVQGNLVVLYFLMKRNKLWTYAEK